MSAADAAQPETFSLEQLLREQELLQALPSVLGKRPQDLEGDERVAYAKDMLLAMIVETVEVLNEVGWKSWATSRHINRNAFADELLDALHFWLNAALLINMDADEIEARWALSVEKIRGRDADGYTGKKS